MYKAERDRLQGKNDDNARNMLTKLFGSQSNLVLQSSLLAWHHLTYKSRIDNEAEQWRLANDMELEKARQEHINLKLKEKEIYNAELDRLQSKNEDNARNMLTKLFGSQ